LKPTDGNATTLNATTQPSTAKPVLTQFVTLDGT
jgi:hypothetical protein